MSGNGSQLIAARSRPETAPVPLAYAQEQLWFLENMEGSSAGYNLPYTLRLKGQVDVRAIEHALKTVVERHTVLRSAIELDQHGRPQQRVCNVTFRMQTKRVRNDADLRRVLTEERTRAFKLSDALKIRATLISGPLANESHEEGIEVQGSVSELATNRRSETSESILVIVLHQIAGDGWSMGVLCQELSVLYSALRAGSEPTLSPLPIQYADYALWQRSCFSEEQLESQLLYWRSQLEGSPALLELPTDYPRPAVQQFRGEIEQLKLSAGLIERLKLFSLSHKATLYMTLLSAFSVLLSRYRGQEDIVVGSPISNRMQMETEPLIGFLANTLVLRMFVAGDKSFIDLLSEVRETTLSAYEHRDLPFGKLVEVLRPTRSLSYSPLIQVMFVLQHMPGEPLSLDGLEVDELNYGAEDGYGAAKFDLTMTLVEEAEGGFRSEVGYNADLFKRSTIKRLLGHFEVILEGILADPVQPVSRLPLLTEAERQQLLVNWNTPSVCKAHGSLVDLFEAEVERAPERPALRFGDVELSYAILNRRSNQLARYLLSMGLVSEGVVALCMSRSIDLIVSMVAVLKAGGCYLPLDPEYPAERQLFMLQDAEAFCILTQGAHDIQANATATRASLPTIAVDAKDALWRNEDDSNITMMRQSNQLAYIMYTSGSTGTPKGVAVEQTGVVRLIKGANYLPIEPDDVWLQLAPATFDASTLEIWGALLNGAQLIVMPSSTPSLSLLGQTIKDNGITHLWLTAGLFTLMVDEQLADLSQLKYLLSGGDVLSPERVAKAFEALPGTQIINGYGPTENTTFTTCYPVACLPEVGEAIPIGKPISGTQVYLLDECRQLVPVGIEGELYVGGEGLARHYVNRPDLTVSAFVDNPFAAGRLYRTGDRARWRENGIIEYLGRRDHQVKHNGYRIELGEIEFALNAQPLVQDAVVVVSAEQTDQLLVAYVVVKEAVDRDELQRLLTERLPHYMVPTHYVMLDRLPLTAIGKIDRRALPDPRTGLVDIRDYKETQSATEAVVISICSSILKREGIVVTDDFFALGGHSLLAMQMIARLNDELKVDVPLRWLFENSTIKSFAARIEHQLQAVRTNPELSLASSTQHTNSKSLSYAQERLWFLNELEGASALYNIPYTLRLSGEIDVIALERSFQKIVERHTVLRSAIEVDATGQPYQQIMDEQFKLRLITDVPESALQVYLSEERKAPFDLSEGLKIRATLFSKSIVVVVLHHIAADGWSMGVLRRELSEFYEAYRVGKEPELPPLAIQYADYAQWQRGWLEGERLAKQLSYWQSQLEGAPALLELPTDHLRPAVQRFRGADVRFELSAQLSERLRAHSTANGVTLYMTLLGAFSVLLSRYSGQTDILVGSPIANRTRVDTESLIGFFVNTLVMRTDLSGELNAEQLLAQIKETTLSAYEHQDVPFEKLVEVLKPNRSMSYSPLFQVMFALQNTPQEALNLPGLLVDSVSATTDVDSGLGIAKFDLALTMTDKSEELCGQFTYSTDLFEGTSITSMVKHFEVLLEQIVLNPSQPVSRLPMLTQTEYERLTAEWNDTFEDYPLNVSLHSLFEDAVNRTPDKTALEFANKSLSYRELNEYSNRLAHYLIDSGIEPGVLVGICQQRSFDMVISLLAVLKAGAVFVPLDPDLPESRLQFLLRDSVCSLLVTDAHSANLITEKSVNQLLFDRTALQLDQCSSNNPTLPVDSSGVAYVIYTSGSTGNPKGAMITHRNLVNYFNWRKQAELITADDRVLQKTNLSFDVACSEIFAPLVSGATVVLAPVGLTNDLDTFSQLTVERKITQLHVPPSLLRLLIEDDFFVSKNSLRRVFSGGEEMTTELRDRTVRQISCKILNGYGPTEATISVMFHNCQNSIGHQKVPIGRPIANTQIYLLDKSQQLVAPGHVGELYVGGECVGAGYWNQPTLTSERFIKNPFGTGMLYRTGDLARYVVGQKSAAPEVEYCGRVDHQVKVRGFRVELGEIEIALNSYPEISEAVVLYEDDPSLQRLVAFFVSSNRVDERALRHFMKSQLPEYMIPGIYYQLESIPLTHNGKIDRQALRRLNFTALPRDNHDDLPIGETEKALSIIWGNLLNVQRVSRHANFFELGGHSLLAMKLVTQIREKLKIGMPLRRIFECSTLSELADMVDTDKWIVEKTDSSLEELGEEGEL